MASGGVDLDALLQRVDRDLRRLPRHEWDGYLWRLCSQLVGSDRTTADEPPTEPSLTDEPPSS